MTGAGFGGCAIAMVRAGEAGGFIEFVREEYERRMGVKPNVFECRPAAGAEILELSK